MLVDKQLAGAENGGEVTVRPYRGQADLKLMQDLVISAPNPFEVFPTAAELPEILDKPTSGSAGNSVLWEDTDGQLLGFAIVSAYRNLHFHFGPGALTPKIEREMMAWAADYARLRFGEESNIEPLTLDTTARNDDAAKRSFLGRHGFFATGTRTLDMVRSLERPVSRPRLPTGFALRPLAGEAEVEALVDAHRSAYGTDLMTVEERRAIMSAPHYKADFDLVATGPDDSIVAFCLCTVDESENRRSGRQLGEISILGTRPECRRRGLARALVLEGLIALRAKRMAMAGLGVSSENEAAVRLYRSLGFRVESTREWYSKPIVV